jgi:calcineurin-like phosphoesterase family protein
MKLSKSSFLRFSTTAILVVIAYALLLSLNEIDKENIDLTPQNNFVYSGTYGLYIEIDNGLTFNWFTKESDKGSYELLNLKNTIIKKGPTEAGKIHKVTIDHKLNKPLIFRFGGNNGKSNEVQLKPIPGLQKSTYKNVDSLYVIGDVHGRYEQLINLLQNSNIVDKELNWIAGKAHIIFLGDLFDRGQDVTKVLWFIYGLEEKAEKSGGKVHLVLGNHEIMTMTKDLRYVNAKELAIAQAYGKKYDELFHPTKSFLGAWLRAKPSILKIDKALFAHGGIVDLGTDIINDFNKQAYTYMNDTMFLKIMSNDSIEVSYDPEKWERMRYFFYAEVSPYWYRGYVNSDTLDLQLDTMLKRYKSKVHVIAHTPLPSITQKYDGKLLTTDLEDAATQLLLLVKKRNKYKRFKIEYSGDIVEL